MAFQTPTKFSGTLNSNYVFSGLFNMIISQTAFADNLNDYEGLVNRFRVDGTLYGDTKLYYATDVGVMWDFPDQSGRTLLTKMPPKDPEVQSVKIDTFKQTGVTIGNPLGKQAFDGADIYGQVMSIYVGWLRNLVRVFQTKLINTYVGTIETKAEVHEVEVTLPTQPTSSISELDHWYKLMGGIIGRAIGDIAIDLRDASRKYNDYGFLRSYDLGDFILVWNKNFDNVIQHLSLPQIFHKDGTLATGMENEVINNIYFGEILPSGTADGERIRSTVDRVIDGVQYLPSDILPDGTSFKDGDAYEEVSGLENGAVICKLVHKRSIPFMSALEIGTEFYNAKDLDRNHYLTIGYSRPTYLMNYPIITFKAKFEDLGGTPEPTSTKTTDEDNTDNK